VRYYNTQEHVNNNSSDHARYTEADDRRVVILETGSAYAGAPSKEAHDTIWAPLYDQKVTLAFAKMLYCVIDVTEFVPAVDMLAVHTAEKDYQIVQSLRFPFNALYEWIERGYIIPMGFAAERGYSSGQEMCAQMCARKRSVLAHFFFGGASFLR
jgi:hypothetical protein